MVNPSSSGPGLRLEEYRKIVGALPAPSRQQMEEFAAFVSGAHSWYKHLPLLPPGLPMQFFLDPGAGMQISVLQDGRTVVAERQGTGFHYSWIPTVDYRRRFGHLAFSRTAGTQVSLMTAVNRPKPANRPSLARQAASAGQPSQQPTAALLASPLMRWTGISRSEAERSCPCPDDAAGRIALLGRRYGPSHWRHWSPARHQSPPQSFRIDRI